MAGNITSWNEQEEAAIRDQLNIVLNSVLFTHADRLGRFLNFVVDETLGGRADRLNQFAIAIEVFDRDETFDPSIDAIVRVEAGRLRSKLIEYFAELGCNDPIRIDLPKRSYVATFQHAAENNSPESAVAADSERKIFSHVDLNRTAKLTEPTIAILPFVNMSPDPEQEYFADGITEDLITDLSNLPGISVISRQSTFSYKNVPVTVQQVCRELGANLVLEGSVRKLGNRVRITAQLIEGSNGQHLWAQRYDHDYKNIFDIQDEVNQKIVEACSLKLSDSEYHKLGQRGTDVIDAYDYVLRGMKESQTNTPENSVRARYCFESALELDPEYSAAYARLALNYIFSWILDWNSSRRETIDKGLELAKKAVALDGKLALAHAALCWAYLWDGDHDKAIGEGRIAIELDSDDMVAHERLALSLIWAGDAKSGLLLIDKARRLNPVETYGFVRGVAMFMLANYDEAIKILLSDIELNPKFIPSRLYLAASYALVGNDAKALSAAADIRQLSPKFNFTRDNRTQFKIPEDRKRFVEGLRIAGFPCEE
jgi:adenylate cyclase